MPLKFTAYENSAVFPRPLFYFNAGMDSGSLGGNGPAELVFQGNNSPEPMVVSCQLFVSEDRMDISLNGNYEIVFLFRLHTLYSMGCPDSEYDPRIP